jgi:hypothetical protein
MTKALVGVLIMVSCGCSDDSDSMTPCEKAVTHYYGAGCKYIAGGTIPMAQVIGSARA